MQSVDASRTELRELNELTVGRLESRMGEVRHELRADIAASFRRLRAPPGPSTCADARLRP